MAADPLFLEAWVNRQDHRIFGRRLEPLSLWHLLALDAIDSPFLPDGGDDATISDYLLAVAILSKKVPVDLQVDPEGIVPSRMSVLRAIPFGRKQKDANAKLRAYFDDYWSALQIWPDGDESRTPIGAPWILAKVAFLLRNTNLTEHRIWSAPIGQILCYEAALLEQVASAKIVSMNDWETMREMQEKEANGGN